METSAQARTFRDWLRLIVAESGLSQWAIAREVGIHPATLAHWVGARRSLPDFPQLVSLCHWCQELPPELADLCPSHGADEEEGS